ncbi:hypothetical protein ACL6C3_22370 [Capilliphycus salinus ALCB114379]
MAGIPEAGRVTMVIILTAIEMAIEGIGLILALRLVVGALWDKD